MEQVSEAADQADQRPGARAMTRYCDDPHAWALEEARLLRTERYGELDFINLADEVADVAQGEYDALESDLARVFQHLPKWDRQAERRGRSWARSIKEHRRRVTQRLTRRPSLKSRLREALDEAYERGRAEALPEIDLPETAFPDVNPSDWDDAMTRTVDWPEP